jgi:hypothetical protein
MASFYSSTRQQIQETKVQSFIEQTLRISSANRKLFPNPVGRSEGQLEHLYLQASS